jgi:hypothetical protein
VPFARTGGRGGTGGAGRAGRAGGAGGRGAAFDPDLLLALLPRRAFLLGPSRGLLGPPRALLGLQPGRRRPQPTPWALTGLTTRLDGRCPTS